MKKILLKLCLVILFIFISFNSANAFYLIDNDQVVREGILQITENEASWIMIIRQLGMFFSLVLVVVVMFFIIGIYSTIRYLSQQHKLSKKLKLILKLILKEPAFLFANNAMRDKRGTYQLAFSRYKSFHQFSQKSLARILGLILVIVVIFTIIAIAVNHDTRAQDISSIGNQQII